MKEPSNDVVVEIDEEDVKVVHHHHLNQTSVIVVVVDDCDYSDEGILKELWCLRMRRWTKNRWKLVEKTKLSIH